MAVAVVAGETTFTVTPRCSSSTAQERANATSAAFGRRILAAPRDAARGHAADQHDAPARRKARAPSASASALAQPTCSRHSVSPSRCIELAERRRRASVRRHARSPSTSSSRPIAAARAVASVRSTRIVSNAGLRNDRRRPVEPGHAPAAGEQPPRDGLADARARSGDDRVAHAAQLGWKFTERSNSRARTISLAMKRLVSSTLSVTGSSTWFFSRSRDLRIAHGLVHQRADALADLGRRALRRPHAVPGFELVARQARLGHRRHVRRERRALRRGDPERARLVAARRRQQREARIDQQLHVAAHDVGQRRRRAAIRHQSAGRHRCAG